MSVIVKGMKMPKSCDDCEFCKRDISGYDWCCIPMMSGRSKPLYEPVMKPDWCPLIPVPPHGDLIDKQWLKDAMITTLEALKKNPKMDRQEMHLIAAFDTLRVMVEDATTIIPADVTDNDAGNMEDGK